MIDKRAILRCFLFLCTILVVKQSSGQAIASPIGKMDTAAINKRVKMEYARRDSILLDMQNKRVQDSIFRIQSAISMQRYRDSLTKARDDKRKADSIGRVVAKQKILDDKRKLDSTNAAIRKKTADSLANAKINAEKIQQQIKRTADSLAAEKSRIADSIAMARKKFNDSISIVRLQQKNAREALEKYRNSKAYKDSVKQSKLTAQQIRQQRLDSLKDARTAYNDSIKTIRQQIADSIRNARSSANQQLVEARQKIADSLTAIRTKRKDSLDKIRGIKEKKAEETAKEKSKEQLNKALAIKVHDEKNKEWTNDKLLKKKWNIPRRIYQNTVTRYNYYYHAKMKYDESIRELKKKNKDDYTQTLRLFPYSIEKDGGAVSGNMDSVIKKASFSTQIHDPRSKWFDNLYFLMAQAYLVKNDYDGAIATFQFVANEYKDAPSKKGKSIKAPRSRKLQDTSGISIASIEKNKGLLHKFKHKQVRNQALIALAYSYLLAEQYAEANSLIDILNKDKNLPAKYKPSVLLTKAAIHLHQHETDEAIASLKQLSKLKTSATNKIRAEFVLAQLLAKDKNYKESTEHYKKSITKKTSDEMSFFAKLKIAENAAASGDDTKFALQQLQSIIRNHTYEKYRSQALHTMALIQAKDNPEKAIQILKESIANPENKDNYLKAISFSELGKLYYQSKQYKMAKISYDSAAFLGNTPPIPNIQEINTRKEVLGKLVQFVDIIQLQDSLLTLSALSDKEKRQIARKELERIKKQKQEEQRKETQVVALQPVNNNQSNWYFYNNSLIQKGAQEFIQKWGTRKLEDNWRRSNTQTFSTTNAGGGQDSLGANNTTPDASEEDLASILKNIPSTPAQKDKATEAIIDAYYQLGLLYYAQLEDYQTAIETFEKLLALYPNNNYRKQCLYALHINHLKNKNIPESTRYKKMLTTAYTPAELAGMFESQGDKEPQLALAMADQYAFYDSAYALYKLNRYQDAMQLVQIAKNEQHVLLAKHLLVEALCFGGLQQFDACKNTLTQVVNKYPNTPEQKRAQELLSYIASKDTSGNDADNKKVIDNLYSSKAADSLEASEAFKELRNAEGKGTFVMNANVEHYVMIFVKNVDGRTMGLKSGVSDYNMLRHGTQNYMTGMNLLTTQQAVISIVKFSNAVMAKKYLQEIMIEKLIFNQFKANEYSLSIISQTNYIELLKSKDILGYMKFYKKSYN